ncbi:MAG: hypothetical protein ACOYL7_17625, partial [Caldilinea sp.]
WPVPPPPSVPPSPTWKHTASFAPSTVWAYASGPLRPLTSPPLSTAGLPGQLTRKRTLHRHRVFSPLSPMAPGVEDTVQ